MINIDIKPTGMESAYVEDKPFDLALAELQAAGYKAPISADLNARLRIEQGKDAYVSRNGNWTREGFIYVPGEDKVRLVKESPILASPVEATQAHREGKEFYLDSIPQQEHGIARELVLIRYDQKPIPTNRFADEEITNFLFTTQAQAYGQFLKEVGIKQMPVWLVGKYHVSQQSKPFVRQCWFNGLDCDSGLDGDGGNFGYSNRLRGVRHAEGDAQKIEQKVEVYTPDQIRTALRQANISGLETQIFKALKNK